METITFIRKKQIFNFWKHSFELLIDDKSVCFLNEGEKKTLQIEQGKHEVRIKYYNVLSAPYAIKFEKVLNLEVKRNSFFLFLGIFIKLIIFSDIVILCSREFGNTLNYSFFLPQIIATIIVIPFYIFRGKKQELMLIQK